MKTQKIIALCVFFLIGGLFITSHSLASSYDDNNAGMTNDVDQQDEDRIPSYYDEQAAPSDEQVAPDDDQAAPDDEQAAPDDEQAAPDDEQAAPDDEQMAPADEQDAAIDHESDGMAPNDQAENEEVTDN